MDNLAFALENGLTKKEFNLIVNKLKREPNKNEIGVIAAMWSEHCSYKSSKFYLKTLVKKSASIGANVSIVCGNTIGQYAMIGAGAVVTKNVEPFALMAGVPAERIGWVNKKGDKVETQSTE